MSEHGTVAGQDGLKWWIGTVEDRGTGQFSGEKDLLKLGRCKVRIKGRHTENKSILPTKDLPWCYIMLPATSASISGVGRSPTGIVEGTKVVGFFMDGDGEQIPIISGVLPHVQQKKDAEQTAVGSGPASTAPQSPAAQAAGTPGSEPGGVPGPNASIDDKLAYANARLAQSEVNMQGPAKGSSEVLTYNGQQYKITY